MGVDIIGDVHGHVDRLEALLAKLGYRQRHGAWRHPEHTAIFVGDLIDRGPGQVRTLEVVRAMVEAGSAEACLGNHEFNAIAFATRDPAAPDRHLRSRLGWVGEKNQRQHAAFLEEVGLDSPEHRRWIDWFMARPLWIERETFRVVHACWSPNHAGMLKEQATKTFQLTPELVEAASRRSDPACEAVEILLKGQEAPLPAGHTFTDKDGHLRRAIRTRWWSPELITYRAAYIGPHGVEVPDTPIFGYCPLPGPDRPTFIGHYWLDPAAPFGPLSAQVACVDYSVGKGGPLAAYRFDGETVLTADRFVAA